MSNELKPCPFCGKPAKVVDSTGDGDFDIMCETVGCYLQDGANWFYQKNEIPDLIKEWNTRNA